MNWHLTVFDDALTRVVYSAAGPRAELEQLAEVLLQEHKTPWKFTIFLRDPAGAARRYPGGKYGIG